MRQKKYLSFSIVVFVLFSLNLLNLLNGPILADEKTETDLSRTIDDFLKKRFPELEPGIAVLAAQDGKIILRKGYGLANMELGVPIKSKHVFRIGSITKQFTAAAIMKMVEQEKISLSDEITKFFPDYPVNGNKITVRHLLNHTSGIRSYTSIPGFFSTIRNDLSTLELIDVFKNEPMDFKPGEEFRYNNSGFVLLGAIIENVSRKPYARYMNETIFKPLGLDNTCYGDHNRIIPNRADGYKPDGDGFANADFISMTQPHAAGALLSTVTDLYKWTEALHSGKVVNEESFSAMITPTKLNNGKTREYGFGLSLGSLFGEKIVDHGGGIHGFSTFSIKVPAKNVFVAVLSNCPGKKPSPEFVGQWIAGLLCGKDVKERTAIKLDAEKMDEIVGVYRISKNETRTITREGDQLYSLRTGGTRLKIYPESEDLFFYENSFSYFTVVRDKKGNVIKMIMNGTGASSEAAKTAEKPVQRKIIKLDNALLDTYAGEYKNDKGMSITLKRENDRFIAIVPGEPPLEIFPESESQFFLKVMDAQIEINKNTQGNVTGITLIMNNEKIPLKKQ